LKRVDRRVGISVIVPTCVDEVNQISG